jgi:hypothetical protein
MDRTACDTQLVAVGNWRVIGQQTARLLAREGAELVHSAPSTGVRDWSDLRIAVSAGIWLGAARPGDMMDIVSDDQAFDAVGDVAATLGVQFRRIPARDRATSRRGTDHARPRSRAPADQARQTPEEVRQAREEVRQASEEEILAFVKRLTAKAPSAEGATLDALSNALKDAGYGRPRGSLRLITRLRRIKDLQVGPEGLIRLASAADPEPAASGRAETDAADAPPRRQRRGRRGGRRRGGRRRKAATDTDTPAVAEQP